MPPCYYTIKKGSICNDKSFLEPLLDFLNRIDKDLSAVLMESTGENKTYTIFTKKPLSNEQTRFINYLTSPFKEIKEN